MDVTTETPFGKVEHIGDILSILYPTTLCYRILSNGTPVICQWLDLDENDESIHIIFKVKLSSLDKYINGEISHLDFIESATNTEYYQFIGELEDINLESFSKIDLGDLEAKCLPKRDSFFDEELSEDIDQIREYFKISKQSETDLELIEKLNKFSDNQNSEIFELHLRNGLKVDHGIVDTKTLGETLILFDAVYNNLVDDIFLGIDKKKRRVFKTNRSYFELYSKFKTNRVVLHNAASYSVYIRPKESNLETTFLSEIHKDIDYSAHNYVSDLLFDNFLSLFSVDSNNIEKALKSTSKKTFVSFKNLLDSLVDNRLMIDFSYSNPQNNRSSNSFVSPKKASKAGLTLSQLESEEEKEQHQVGKFAKIDVDTGYLKFRNSNGITYTGYIIKEQYESLENLNFKDKYKVLIKETIKTRILSQRRSYIRVFYIQNVINSDINKGNSSDFLAH